MFQAPGGLPGPGLSEEHWALDATMLLVAGGPRDSKRGCDFIDFMGICSLCCTLRNTNWKDESDQLQNPRISIYIYILYRNPRTSCLT